MTTTHTPGPWDCMFADGINVRHPIIRGDKGTICQSAWMGNADETNANARLIAAAPDLLEALTRLVDIDDGNMGVIGWDAVIDAARAAIAKATGGVA